MARLIEVQDARALPSRLTLRVGDLLTCGASGGHVRSGAGIVEMLGPFLPGVLTESGEALSPEGAPNTVLFLARRPGQAEIDVVTGDPWRAPRAIPLQITVDP